MWRVLALILCAGVVACSEPVPVGFHNTDISGGALGNSLAGFRDHRGRSSSLADFRGKTVIVLFGYTRCPDVCPTLLARLATVMKKLGSNNAEHVQVLMVSVDPEHDTPQKLATYMTAFNPSFLGLYSDHPTTEAAAKAFKVFYSPASENAMTNPVLGHPHESETASVQINHSAGSYVFDANGNIRLYVKDDAPTEAIASDLKWLLAGQ
jgi:protein SCO1